MSHYWHWENDNDIGKGSSRMVSRSGTNGNDSYDYQKIGPLLPSSFQYNATRTQLSPPTPIPQLPIPPRSLDEQQQRLTEPWDIVDQYIAWHSHEALQQQDPFHPRDYALSFYSCPLQAGNRWHHFLNSFLWSILTNRTMLWQYWDTPTCQVYGRHYDSRICHAANTVSDCDPHIQRKPWITSYQRWTQDQPATNRSKNVIQAKQLSYWTTHFPSSNSKAGRGVRSYDNSTKTIQLELGIDARPGQYPLVVFPQMLGQYGKNMLAVNETVRNHLLHTQWARQTVQVLYKHGADLLYGLLFYSAFSPTPHLIANSTAMILPNPNFAVAIPPSPSSSQLRITDNNKEDTHDDATTNTSLEVSKTCSIAVHSRHANKKAQGDIVAEETACIESIWQQHLATTKNDSHNDECDLYVMSDRPLTLLALIAWCHNYHPPKNSTSAAVVHHEKKNASSTTTVFPCRRVIHAMHQRGLSFVPEHGPYAGVGFLQDLIVVQESALSSIGIVGGQRSSTELLTEWMEYERLVDYFSKQKDEHSVPGDNNNKGVNDSTDPSRQRLSSSSSTSARPIPELPRCIMSSSYETGRPP
jgi:hypothetical protein